MDKIKFRLLALSLRFCLGLLSEMYDENRKRDGKIRVAIAASVMRDALREALTRWYLYLKDATDETKDHYIPWASDILEVLRSEIGFTWDLYPGDVGYEEAKGGH